MCTRITSRIKSKRRYAYKLVRSYLRFVCLNKRKRITESKNFRHTWEKGWNKATANIVTTKRNIIESGFFHCFNTIKEAREYMIDVVEN